jgi:hypothetical protein
LVVTNSLKNQELFAQINKFGWLKEFEGVKSSDVQKIALKTLAVTGKENFYSIDKNSVWISREEKYLTILETTFGLSLLVIALCYIQMR